MAVDKDLPHRGWHSRGYLPHLDAGGILQAVTFRLADSLPKEIVDGWKRELELEASSAGAPADPRLRERIARYEDAGHGSSVLRDPACAAIVQDALLHFDGDRYRLLEWCVMPNHVHVLIHCPRGTRLGDLVKSWKTHSSRRINRHLGRQGTVWAVDYHDRYIRDFDHLASARRYIRHNPVKAGLCRAPEDWPWSSASHPGPLGSANRSKA